MKKKPVFESSLSEQNSDDEIDPSILFSFIFRNKYLISAFASITFVFACFYSFTLKKVWEGQFQIVLNSEKVSKINSLNLPLSALIESNQASNLKTQVGVLNSPSVLMPIYELVNEVNTEDLKMQGSFNNWKSNLDVELQKGTSILNIAYRDTNKEIILPALKKMSFVYQNYSKSIKKRRVN